MSIDLEDWFCAYNLSSAVPRDEWDDCELRVSESTERILNLLDRFNVRATFFVLGWIAERLPGLVRTIEQRNHEIGVHGYDHHLLTQITPAAFEEDLKRTLKLLHDIGIKQEIVGFRAPSFTIVKKTEWAFSVLQKYNFKYDSSIFPIGFHPDYGMPDAPLAPYRVNDSLTEFPLSCVEILGRRFPCAGGGYFRIFPYAYSKQCIKQCNAQGRSAVFYLHPWELDPGQPRVSLPWPKRLRHYYGIANTEKKLEKLLGDFQFTTLREILDL